MFDQASHSLSYLRAGTIKVFAVTSKARTVSAPDVPTTDEGGLAGFHSANWYGLWAPKGTPKDIVARVNRAVVESLADPELRQAVVAAGPRHAAAPISARPRRSAAFHKSEIEKWWPILQAAGIKAK